jgi:L-fuculose-phosphate aldolase
MAHQALRRKLITVTQEMSRLGLNTGVSGNASVRAGAGYLVTPTGMDYATLKPADIVEMDFQGNARGKRAPSSEWPFHGDILAGRAEFNAVLHAHPPYTTALACLGKRIPAFHYMVAVAGGRDIRCGAYATFGTKALSKNALKALEGRWACLLSNHGMIACGEGLDAALALAQEVENLSRQYLLALSAGKPRILPASEMDKVLGLFKSYGRQPDKGAGRTKSK